MNREQYERIEKLDMKMHKYQLRYIRHLIDEADLYKGDPRLIMAVVKKEGCTQAELAKTLCVKPATMTVMIQRMENAGLIERRTDKNDMRILRAYSTQQGREMAKKTEEIFQKAVCNMFDGIPEGELSVYESVLEKISERLKNSVEEKEKAAKRKELE